MRRKLRQNLIAAGRCTAPRDCLAAAEPVEMPVHRRIHSAHFSGAAVDNAGTQSLYRSSRRAARFGAMARLRSPSLFTVNEHPAMILWP